MLHARRQQEEGIRRFRKYRREQIAELRMIRAQHYAYQLREYRKEQRDAALERRDELQANLASWTKATEDFEYMHHRISECYTKCGKGVCAEELCSILNMTWACLVQARKEVEDVTDALEEAEELCDVAERAFQGADSELEAIFAARDALALEEAAI